MPHCKLESKSDYLKNVILLPKEKFVGRFTFFKIPMVTQLKITPYINPTVKQFLVSWKTLCWWDCFQPKLYRLCISSRFSTLQTCGHDILKICVCDLCFFPTEDSTLQGKLAVLSFKYKKSWHLWLISWARIVNYIC